MAFDHAGNLFVGLGAAQDTARAGEILRLEFDAQGDLFVGGGNFFNGEIGFIAQVDVTGQVVDRFDPVDGDPDDGDIRFFEITTTPSRCRLGASDLFSFFNADESIIYQRSVCAQ